MPRKTTGKQASDEATPRSGTSKPAPAGTRPGTTGEPVPVGFPVVAIGASAGGLEAIEQLFVHLPDDTGMAFVLVQHLDPHHNSILGKLVSRFTTMPVTEAIHGQPVEPNRVYVIPPQRDLAILNGVLQLMTPTGPRHLRLSIDYFFRSLARDRGASAIGVILSGAGSDGTLGVRAIKGEGGIVLVQDPETAAYDSMPASAVATGLADVVLSPGEIGPWLRDYDWDSLQPQETGQVRGAPQTDSEIGRLFVLVRNRTGYDFSLYKEGTIGRRIERRMVVNQVKKLADYIDLLQESEQEVDRLWKEFLIRVTQFFRNPEAFETLAQRVLQTLFSSKPDGQPLRIWVPACSTGEEAYTIGILVQNHMDRTGKSCAVQIFATDIDDEALDIGRAGVYPETILADVPGEFLRRYFVRHPSGFQVAKQIRSMMVFSRHDITRDPPFSRVDLVSCRNLLIYMCTELQVRVLDSLSYALRSDGVLFIGHSEHIGRAERLYEALDSRAKLYRRNGTMLREHGSGQRPAWRTPGDKARPSRGSAPVEDIQQLTQKALLKDHAPACVVIDRHRQVQYFHGHVGLFLEPPAGRPSMDILKMARDGLQTELHNAIRQVLDGEPERRCERLPVKQTDGTRLVRLMVRPLPGTAGESDLLMVLFEDEGLSQPAEDDKAQPCTGTDGDTHVARLEQELSETRETLQEANEQLESSNEELHSTVEELQSSNEELMTSQEELSSINEELHTVNCELEEKVRELETTSNDLENLLVSTEIATVFLDLDLCVRRFTPTAARIINLIDSDIGRPLGDISHQLDYDSLIADAESVLDQVRPLVREVRSTDGIRYSLRIGLYRTSMSAIDGVVLTFVDLTERILEEQRFLDLLELTPDATLISDASGSILQANRQAETLFGYSREELVGRQIEFLVPVALRDRHGDERRAYQGHPEVRQMGQRGQALAALRKDGSEFNADIAVGPIQAPEGRLFVACVRDASEMQMARRRLARSNRLIVGFLRWQREVPRAGAATAEALQRLCRELVDFVGYRACWIGLPDKGNTSDLVQVASHGLRSTTGTPFGPSGPPPGLERKAIIVDGTSDDETTALRDWVLAVGCRSALAVPLAAVGGGFGLLVVCGNEHNDFVIEEVALWQTLAESITAALDQPG